VSLPTTQELDHALAVLGNYRCLRVQELMWPYHPIPASIMLGLGFRETGLENIVGGAVMVNGEWVFSDQDAGYLQISREFEADFLRTAEGCKSGQWGPSPPHNALEKGYVPRFTPATEYVKRTMINSMEFAHSIGVKEADLLRFAVAAHNAGDGGAQAGYQQGDVDKFTAHGDYSAYVMALQPAIHTWIAAHPAWIYHRTEGEV
jgi:hypothetical protein